MTLTYYSPYLSGLTLYAKRLATGLSKEKFSVKILTMKHLSSLLPFETLGGIDVIRASYIAKISKGFISLDWIGKSFNEVAKCDALIVHLPQPESIFPVLFAKLFQKRILVIYHCDVVLPKTALNMLIMKVLDIFSRMVLMLADVIVNNSEDFASHSRVLSRFLKKIKYIYPPIDFPKIDKRSQKLLYKKIGKRKGIVIGAIGRLSSEKGWEYLLDAIPYIEENDKEPPIILFSFPNETVGEDEYKKKIMTMIEKYRKNIISMGQLRDDELGAFYSSVDVLVIPSVNATEAFGMTQIEAMSLGIPVVASDLPGVRVPIQKTGMGEIVPIRNSRKLAQAICTVSSHTSRYRKKKEFIRHTFSLQKTLEKFRSLLRE